MVFAVFTLALAGVFLIFVKLTYDALNRNFKARPPYPPGPKPNVLIGNALDFPKSDAGRIFAEWGKTYNSDILHASAFGQHMVVINSRKIAEDLLEKRAKIYNDRPEIPILDILGWDDNVALLRYGDFWRQHRKLCHQNFHREAARRYHPIQIDRVHYFLRSLLQQPEKVFQHNRLLSISVTMLMMYGYAPKTLEYPVIHAADESTQLAASLLGPGGTFLNILPVLRHIPSWVPGTSGKKMAEKVRLLTEEVKRTPMEYVKAALQEGTASPSFVTDFLERKATVDTLPGEETVVHNIAWTIYGAASDTTISATDIFLFLMIKHPDVQRKAQEEIDRVIGNNRLPDHNDRPDLPYIEALYREVLRYNQPLRIGVPHALMEDDIYEGYFLPKGAIVTSNIWAMTHDEDIYPDPFSFKPERYLDEDGRVNDDDRILAYGFGTRICVGKSVASDLMWLIITSFLACFNIDKAKDEDGNQIEVDETFFEIGLLTQKKPFENSIRPRSEAIQNLIHSALT